MSVFREVLLFLDHVGVYDVVLPMLLIFSMVFAILEKTRIFGTEKVQDTTVTRKNINAMVAFVASFFVVASAQLVAAVHMLIAQVSLLIVLFVMFMILLGIFHKEGEIELKGGWKTTFMVISFIAIALIFFNAVGWLMPAWQYLVMHWDSTFVATLVLVGGMGLFIYVMQSNPPKEKKKE